MKVLVTGGAGFIGRRCVRELLERGRSVRVLSRSGRAVEGAEGAAGDISRADSLARAVDGVEAVIHCVGIIIEPRGQTFETVVAEGTRNLVAACQSAGVRHVTFISALGTRADAPARYHRTKWQAEEAIRQSGIEWTILRASIVYGKGDGFLSRFLRMPFIPLPGGGRGLFQPIHVDDLARIAVESLQNPAARSRTFDAAGPERFSFRGLMEEAHRLLGRRKLAIPIPMPVMALLAAIHDPFQRLYPPLALFTRDQYRMMREDNVGDNGPLCSAFPGVRLRTLAEGMADYRPAIPA